MPKKIKDGAYVITLGEYADVDTHCIALFCTRSEIGYFNSSVMWQYFCIGFIDFMLAGKKLTDFASLFSPYDFKKNDNIILNYFKDE